MTDFHFAPIKELKEILERFAAINISPLRGETPASYKARSVT